mmetsp:Transcript_15503/g.22049  ORF Transcript_15503/g.22049 Transcript_15503/m.22049 type:complete len:391 (-) Transcript_15503:689-1861(-)
MSSWPGRPVENRVLIPDSLSGRRAFAVEWCMIVEGIVGALPTISITESILVGRVELEVYVPAVLSTSVMSIVLNVMKEGVSFRDGCHSAVVDLLHFRIACAAHAFDDTIGCSSEVIRLSEGKAKSFLTKRRNLEAIGLTNGIEVVTTCDNSPLTNIVIITRFQRFFAKSFLNSHVTVAVGDDFTSLTPLTVTDLAFVEETAHVSPEIVVTVIDSLARIEVDINESDASINLIGSAIVSDPEPLGGVNLGTVRASDGGHLLDASTHGRTRNILDVSTLIHVVIHCHKEDVVTLVPSRRIINIIGPCQSMTMDCTLTVTVVARESNQSFCCVSSRDFTSFHINVAQICVISWILVNTVLAVSVSGTVTIVVIRLTILGPAAHGGASGTSWLA